MLGHPQSSSLLLAALLLILGIAPAACNEQIQKLKDIQANDPFKEIIPRDVLRGLAARSRSLQEIPPEQPPARECGQIINVVTVDEIKMVASSIINGLFGDNPLLVSTVLPQIEQVIQYDVQAQVVCGSCNEVRDLYAGADFLGSTGRHSFNDYCGTERWNADVVQSGLLLIPVDPTSAGQQIEGVIKSYVFMKGFNSLEQSCPSESWLDDFSVFNTTDQDVFTDVFLQFFNGWTSMMIASAGVVVVAPDYLGFGQSYRSVKGNGILYAYQQAAAICLLKAKTVVEGTGCTMMGPETSGSGFSEGGAAIAAGMKAVELLGQNITNVDIGGAPLNVTFQFAWSVDEIDMGTISPYARENFAVGSTFYSSKLPDLPNSNAGQDLLNPEWRDFIVNYSNTNAALLMLDGVIPNPATDIWDPAFLNKTRALLERNITNCCISSTPGVDDLLCEAMELNSFVDLVVNTTYPTSICHSPEDEIIPFGNAPNVSLNPNLYPMTVFSFPPSGSHFESNILCYTGYILQFGDGRLSPNPLNGIDPLPDPATCDGRSPTTVSPTIISPVMPVTPTEIPTSQPTPGSGATRVWSGMWLGAVVTVLLAIY